MQILLAVLVCLGCYSAIALECKFCMQYGGKSDNKDIQASLDMLKSVGNTNCKDNPGDTSVTSMQCPPGGQGQKAVCATASIGATSAIPGTDLEMNLELYIRMCQAVADTEESSCSSIDKYENEIKQGMGPQADNLKGLDGQMCLCEGNNCNTEIAPQIAGNKEPQMAGSEVNETTPQGTGGEKQQVAGSAVIKPVVLSTSLLLFLVHLLV